MSRKHRLFFMVMLLGISWTVPLESVVQLFEQPKHFPQPAYHFNTNELHTETIELGRRLFYEPRFSRDNTVSCGTCHIQSAGFTHHGHDVSHGIDDRLGSRNSPPIMNLAWSTSFFWDGGVFDLDLQPIVPITNPVEMDESMNRVMDKLRQHKDYPTMFKRAFGTEEINTERVMKALSQFMLTLVSAQAKYDSVVTGMGVRFTDAEQRGYTLFRKHCNGCHREPLFTDNSFRNNGIGAGPNDDKGRYLVTLNEKELYTFKVPSLRNLAYSAPYMHDGRFMHLQAVLDHYAGRIREMPTLDTLLRQNGTAGLALNKQEQEDLLAFLNTLNDQNFVHNKIFSEQ